MAPVGRWRRGSLILLAVALIIFGQALALVVGSIGAGATVIFVVRGGFAIAGSGVALFAATMRTTG
jgi:hypothetical protein